MEKDETIRKVKGDSPLESLEHDEFGLAEMVDGVAAMLATRTPDDGFSLGIEGSWGSGKSTFANFVADKLRQYEDHFVIRFEPWLIGEKSALIASFLGQFASEIDKFSPKQWRWWQYRRWIGLWRSNHLSKSIRKYGGYLSALSGPVAGAAAIDPTGSTALAATGLKTAGLLSRFFGKEESLEELKTRIIDGLRALHSQRRSLCFTVMIDDTDRLDAVEAVEILRLIRKAADFPYVSHVVCFDAKILSQQVSTALNIEDGRKYLERIFQDIIHIPPQEPFALRRYLKRLLKASFPAEMIGQDNETEYRMEMVFDRWGGRLLNTPRDVVRLYQAIEFAWPHVPKGSDFCDFVWLQLLKLTCEDFYEWVRDYLQNVGSYRDRGRPGDSEAADQGKKLLELLKRFGWHERIWTMSNELPT
jgi:predicted KAP-like P-loop ATPase